MLCPYANRVRNASYQLNGKMHYMERNEDRGIYGKGGLKAERLVLALVSHIYPMLFMPKFVPLTNPKFLLAIYIQPHVAKHFLVVKDSCLSVEN